MYKTISKYPNYEVSDQGIIRNKTTGHVLKAKCRSGRYCVTIYGKDTYVHRLVAEAFIPNLDSKPLVSHINGDRADNRAANLEWAYSTTTMGFGRGKTVLAKNEFGEKEYKTIKDAADALGVSASSISEALETGHLCKGYHWSYKTGATNRQAAGEKPAQIWKPYVPVEVSKCKKPVDVLNDDGSITRYDSIVDAASQLNITPKYLANMLHRGSWKYKFFDEEFKKPVKSNGGRKLGSGNPLIKDNRRLYGVWMNMKQRCFNENNQSYKEYGGRGITVCDEWLDFSNFVSWANETGYDKEAPKGECTIDRIDCNGNYEPSNCRWISCRAQSKNRRGYFVQAEVLNNKCSECGTEVMKGYIFCPYCGSKLV